MTTYISVNRQYVSQGKPAIRIATSKSGKGVYCRSVRIDGPSKLVFSPNKPILKCGARLVLTTEARVRYDRRGQKET